MHRQFVVPKVGLIVLSLVALSTASGQKNSYNLMETAAWAELVIVGTVQTISSYNRSYVDTPYPSHPETKETIENLYSDYEIKVERVIKGDISTEHVTIISLGGFNGGGVTRWSHLATLMIGKKYLLMAVPSDMFPGEWVIANGAAGAIELLEKEGEYFLANSGNIVTLDPGINDSSDIKLSDIEAHINAGK